MHLFIRSVERRKLCEEPLDLLLAVQLESPVYWFLICRFFQLPTIGTRLFLWRCPGGTLGCSEVALQQRFYNLVDRTIILPKPFRFLRFSGSRTIVWASASLDGKLVGTAACRR